MSTRFISNIVIALVGAVVVAREAFSSGVTCWLTFGVGLGVVALAGVAHLDPMHGPAQRHSTAEAARSHSEVPRSCRR